MDLLCFDNGIRTSILKFGTLDVFRAIFRALSQHSGGDSLVIPNRWTIRRGFFAKGSFTHNFFGHSTLRYGNYWSMEYLLRFCLDARCGFVVLCTLLIHDDVWQPRVSVARRITTTGPTRTNPGAKRCGRGISALCGSFSVKVGFPIRFILFRRNPTVSKQFFFSYNKCRQVRITLGTTTL